MSDKERYLKAKEIFNVVLSLKESEREARAAKECAGDELLLTAVRRLLEGDRQAGGEWEKAVDDEINRAFSAVPYDEASDLVGQRLNNRYLVRSKLGSGSFGAACLASDLLLHSKPVVIKVLIPNRGRNEWAERKFHQEIAALSRINHAGVVGVFDSGDTPDGRPFFVMEYIEGPLLRSAITAGRMNFERAANIMRQLGRALSAAHEKGVYHRDLKPENILLQSGEEERVKVIDFGMATVKETFDEKTKITAVAGTLSYMAPEQLQGKPSASSDIYALGVIAYEMLTGRQPFDAESFSNDYAGMFQLSERQQEGVKVKPIELRHDLPLAAQEEILKALSYNPKDRHSRARDFGDNLANALLGSHQKQPAYSKVSRPAPADSNNEEGMTKRYASRFHTLKTTFLAQSKTPRNARLSAAALILLIIATVGAVGFFYIKNAQKGSAANGQERALSYWGELQQYRDEKPFGTPTRLTGGVTGETYFNSGDGLKFFVTPSEDGYLYLINEASEPDKAAPIYTLLFPSMEANNGSSEVDREQLIETSQCIFDENAGTEKVWIVWSANRIEELEKAVRQWSNAAYGGEIRDAEQAESISNLIKKRADAKPAVEPDEANERMKLRGKGDVLIYSLKLKHR